MNVSFTFPLGTSCDDIVHAIYNHFGTSGTSPIRISGEPLTVVVNDNPSNQMPGIPAGAPSVFNTAVVELDEDKRPWDARIDSGTPSKTAKGLWKARKGVDPRERAKVIGELQAIQKAAAPAPTTTAALPGLTPTGPALPTAASALPGLGGEGGPALPGAVVERVPDPANNYLDFVAWLMPHMQTDANPGGVFTEKYISDICLHYQAVNALNVGSITALQADPAKLAQVHGWLVKQIKLQA